MLAAKAARIVVNNSPSLPVGFYRETSEPVTKGSLVIFRGPAQACEGRPYAQDRLIKMAVAMQGDRVSVSPEGVTVNGKRLANSQPRQSDRHGQAMPVLELKDYELREGEVMPMSDYNPHSFDGRYYGPIKARDAVVLRAVWTWDAP